MPRIDTFPTHQAGSLQYRAGHVFPFGASLLDGGVNFSVYSREATGCTLVLYHAGDEAPFAEIPFLPGFRIGDVYTMLVFGLNPESVEYGYRFNGPWRPEEGLLFDPERVLLDPYARSVSGRDIWRSPRNPACAFQHRGRIIPEDYDWDGEEIPDRPLTDLVIYEMHIRSFTAHPSSQVRHPGTFAGVLEKLPHLRELGINCVELMPVFAFDEMETFPKRINYWGYSTLGFFAPKAGYAASGHLGMEADELKHMVRTLHQNGIEVILDVVFNHTAEMDLEGPTISFRGVDNRTYYLLTPQGEYMNYSGCGNTMNCNHPVVRSMILDCLRYWVTAYHIDGFRFDLASILTRDESGQPMQSPPILEALALDPVLGRCKLIAEAWDAGGLYQVGSFPSWNRWSEWNGLFRDCVRRFVKGDADASPELIRRICGSPDLYGSRSPAASINFVTCHDGFTLYDLTAYNQKHNEANGEDNRDGTDWNLSWNCGWEGDTEDQDILALRIRQMKNMLTLLLVSRGTPMLLSGDEMARSQGGNNNAYCQDNPISWLNWEKLEEHRDLYDSLRTLLAFRAAHPVLRADHFDTDPNGTGYPELSFHGPVPWNLDWNTPTLTLALLWAEDHEKYGTESDAFLYILLNAHWETHDFTLPVVPAGFHWRLVLSSHDGNSLTENGPVRLFPRSSMILEARP